MVYENDIFLAELMLLLLFIAHLPPIYFFALFFFLSITLFLHQSHHFPYPHWIHLFFKFSLVSTSYNLPIFFLAFSLASLYFQFFFLFLFLFLFLFPLRCYNFGLMHSFCLAYRNFDWNFGTGRNLLLV